MCTRRLAGLLLTALMAAGAAGAEERLPPTREITIDQALELARQQAPALAVARARVGEAVGAVDEANVWRFNPELEAKSGPRRGPAETTTDWSVGARQRFETGGRRQLRREAAHAGLEAEEARAATSRRQILHGVATAFVETLYWQERVALARENARIMEEIARVARRRHEVGQTGGLEESLSSLSLERARISQTQALAELDQEKRRLMTLLGLEAAGEIEPQGDLRDIGLRPVPETMPDVEQQPELQALAAEVRRAESEYELGRAGRWPDLALGVSWGREEEADLVHGHLGVALPIFDRGQGKAALAHSRRLRIEAQLDSARQRVRSELERARETCGRLSSAARRFEDRGLPDLERSAQLATANYDAGAIPMTELLVVQRELVRARIDYTDLLLGAATARIDLAAGLGEYR